MDWSDTGDQVGPGELKHAHELPPPLFVLAPVRSFTSVVCAMIGQHPQMYGLPETNLLCHATVGGRLQSARNSPHRSVLHGLLRLVAEVYFSAQTEYTVQCAREWLRAHSALETEQLFRLLARKLFPRVLVEKSPSSTNRIQCLRRIAAKFPSARYVHLLRHPRGHGESVIRAIDHESARRDLPPEHWLLQVATYRPPHRACRDRRHDAYLDPQHWWYDRNRLILEFLESVPAARQMRVRGEAILSNPDQELSAVAAWLGLRTDPAAIDLMKHPERSPYAFLGPPGAKFGNDEFFLRDPLFRPSQTSSHTLDGPLSWRIDGGEFLPEVKALASELGYA